MATARPSPRSATRSTAFRWPSNWRQPRSARSARDHLRGAARSEAGFSPRRGRSSTSPRHETLMATIEWSFKLLLQKEATLFGALSVFSDAFEARTWLSSPRRQGSLVDVAAGLGSLVTKSLLSAQARQGRACAIGCSTAHVAMRRAAPSRSSLRRSTAPPCAARPDAV